MTGKELSASNIADLQSLLRRREISPREVLDVLRARIEDVDRKIDAYLSTDFEAAAEEAEKADVDLPLGGVPIAIKDIISVAGRPCTCASKILQVLFRGCRSQANLRTRLAVWLGRVRLVARSSWAVDENDT